MVGEVASCVESSARNPLGAAERPLGDPARQGFIVAVVGMVGGVAFEIRSSDLTPKTRLLKAGPRAVRAMLCDYK
ncbi:hypothetical protein MNBD_ACTINO02-900 [hydrothermal vent metagenome]|uniref:Uncharacterized protein n=1 Tax=hydrothermal vent metagenome TaxID=652676 RepID=A0A3B0SV97_9ZZZZ